MLFLFRNNETSSVFLLAPYIGLLHLPALAGFIAFTPCAGGGALADWPCQWVSTEPFWSAIAASLLVLVQALLVNRLDQNFRLATDRTWVPGMMYALVASALPQFQFLSPTLLGVTFIPISLFQVFSTYKQHLAFRQVFDAGFWLAIGGLFYPPIILLTIPAFMGLGSLRSFTIRERLVFISGIFVPFFLCWLWYFWNDSSGLFWEKQLAFTFGIQVFNLLNWNIATLVQFGFMSLFVLFCLASFGLYYRKKLIQIQKYISILYWFVFVAGLGLLFQKLFSMDYFLLLAPSLGLFFSLSFLNLRNRAMAEMLHLILFCVVLGVLFLR